MKIQVQTKEDNRSRLELQSEELRSEIWSRWKFSGNKNNDIVFRDYNQTLEGKNMKKWDVKYKVKLRK